MVHRCRVGGSGRLLMSGKWTGGTMDANVARLIAGGVEALTIDASTQEISLPLGLVNFTAIATPSAPASGHARLWYDSTLTNLFARDGGGVVNHGVRTRTVVASNFLTGIADNGQTSAAQPAFTDISGTLGPGQFGPLTGDVTTVGYAATLRNIPANTPFDGNLVGTLVASPGTPVAGLVNVYVDSTSHNLVAINSGGVINHGAQSVGAASHQWLRQLNDDGSWTSTQPAFTDISGTLGSAQFGPLTGSVTTSGYVATLANIPNDTTMPGDLLTGVISFPATPSAGHGRAYHDSAGSGVWAFLNSGGIRSNTIIGLSSPTTSKWVQWVDTAGIQTLVQPAFTDILGTLAAGQFGPLTGDVTTSGYAATLRNIPVNTPFDGNLTGTAVTAPSTPAGGLANVWVDSTAKNLMVKNDAGTVNHGVQTSSAPSHQWVTGVSDAGVLATSQPSFSDISSTLLASQYTFGITLATFTFGYINSTPSPLIGTGTTVFLRPETSATGLGGSGGLMQWHVPFALVDIEVFLNVDSWADGGTGGTYSVTLMKNGATTAANVTVTSTGTKLLSGGPISFVAGDRDGFQAVGTGTVGVRTDFCLFARGKTVKQVGIPHPSRLRRVPGYVVGPARSPVAVVFVPNLA